MRFKSIGCEESWRRSNERKRDLRMWHQWFAWHPVRVAPTKVCWLETVERRFASDKFGGEWPESWWEYRLKGEVLE